MPMGGKKGGRKERPAEIAAWRKTIAWMPLTLRPALNQQVAEWDALFPFEQTRLADFFRAADSFSPAELNNLMANLRALESKMGIANASFSESGESLEYASQIARSAYYAQWRSEVQRVFSAIEAKAATYRHPESSQRRLVLLILPTDLPVERRTMNEYWRARGSEFSLRGGSDQLFRYLMAGEAGSSGVLDLLEHQSGSDPSNVWFIDAGTALSTAAASMNRGTHYSALSFSALKPFRDQFLAQLNTIPRDLSEADQVVASLRRTNWKRWCPAELKSQSKLRRFVVNLYLSGNGALIFSDAFAEWAASEAIRRARPRVVVARFGMRSKPKPFTSIAIFENQNKVSVLPDVDDPVNSAVDAAILARYVWLAAMRYPEYEQSLCLCISDHLNAGWIVAPPGVNLTRDGSELSAEKLSRIVTDWLMATA